MCSQREAAEDIWKIDEQPDVFDVSFDVQRGWKKQFLSYLMFSYFKVTNYNISKLQC